VQENRQISLSFREKLIVIYIKPIDGEFTFSMEGSNNLIHEVFTLPLLRDSFINPF
jgi:hypothetical protein